MQQISAVLTFCFLGIASGAEGPLPAELIGEWRNSLSRPAYGALYLHADGTAYSVAVSGEQRNHGGKGAATYDAFRRTVTITYPGDKREFRFRYDPDTKRLVDLSGLSPAYRKKGDKVPDLSIPLQPAR